MRIGTNFSKLFSLLLIMLLICCFQSVSAETCFKEGKCSKCNTVCQYKNGEDVVIFAVKMNKTNPNNNLYEVGYLEKFNGVGAAGGLPYTNDTASNLYKFDKLISGGYADLLNINNDLTSAIESKAICSEYAYDVGKPKTCFDNDGDACKKKYGKKIKKTYTKKDASEGVVDGCGIYKGQFSEEVVTETGEQEFINKLTENKIVLKEEPINNPNGTCEGMFGEKVSEDLNMALKYIQYIGPILVIVLGILDFIKAVASGSTETFNSAWKKLLKRLIIAILLFFIVVLLKFVLKIFGIIAPADCFK